MRIDDGTKRLTLPMTHDIERVLESELRLPLPLRRALWFIYQRGPRALRELQSGSSYEWLQNDRR